jgi:hypothetical protein
MNYRYFVAFRKHRSGDCLLAIRLGKRISQYSPGYFETVEGARRGDFVYASFWDDNEVYRFRLPVASFYGKDWRWLGAQTPITDEAYLRGMRGEFMGGTGGGGGPDPEPVPEQPKTYTLEELFEMDEA